MYYVCIRKLYRLTPGAVYYYKYGDDQYGWSDEYMFKAAPPKGGTVRIVAYGGNIEPNRVYLLASNCMCTPTLPNPSTEVTTLCVTMQCQREKQIS